MAPVVRRAPPRPLLSILTQADVDDDDMPPLEDPVPAQNPDDDDMPPLEDAPLPGQPVPKPAAKSSMKPPPPKIEDDDMPPLEDIPPGKVLALHSPRASQSMTHLPQAAPKAASPKAAPKPSPKAAPKPAVKVEDDFDDMPPLEDIAPPPAAKGKGKK